MRVRNRRTWRRFYTPGRRLVWRKRIVFDGVSYAPGDFIPDNAAGDKGWCRRRWISRLLDFWDQFPYEENDPRRPGYVPPEPVPDDPEPSGGDSTADIPPVPPDPEAETEDGSAGDGDGAEVDDPEPSGGDPTTDSPPVPPGPPADRDVKSSGRKPKGEDLKAPVGTGKAG